MRARALAIQTVFSLQKFVGNPTKKIFFFARNVTKKKKMRINVVPLSSCIVLYEFIVSLTVYRLRYRRIIY